MKVVLALVMGALAIAAVNVVEVWQGKAEMPTRVGMTSAAAPSRPARRRDPGSGRHRRGHERRTPGPGPATGDTTPRPCPARPETDRRSEPGLRDSVFRAVRASAVVRLGEAVEECWSAATMLGWAGWVRSHFFIVCGQRSALAQAVG